MKILQLSILFKFVHGFINPSIRIYKTPPLFTLQVNDEYADLLNAEEGIYLDKEDELEFIEENIDDDELASKFLELVEDIPIGELQTDEFLLLRDTMQQLSTNDSEDAEETVSQLERILNRMLEEYSEALKIGDSTRLNAFAPTSEDFLMVMESCHKAKSSTSTIINLFFQQEDIYKSAGICKPTSESVQIVLDALASSRGKKGADRTAKALIERLPNFQLTANPQMYTSLIACLARDRSRMSASRAEEALEKAIELFPPKVDEDGNNIGMTVNAFNVVITAWAKSDWDIGPDNARNLLLRMEAVDAKRGILKPTVSSFTSLIDAYAQKNNWEGACEAERTLNVLLEEYLEGRDITLEPNIATFGIVLSSWARLSKKGSSDAASRADNLLLRMEDLSDSGKLSFAPDAVAYVTVMRAWALGKDTEKGPARAEEILDEMNERYLDGEDDFKPSSKSVRSIIEAWAKSNRQDAMFKADELFEKYDDYLYEEDEMNIVQDIFKSLIFGWNQRFDPEKAHEYLEEMVERNLKPDSFCFDRVIEAYIKEEFPSLEQVKSVFNLMEKCSLAGDLKPNERVYTSFIRALTKAKVPMLPQKACTVLERMNVQYREGNKGVKPTVFTYNAVLRACASSISNNDDTNLEAFKIALNIFNKLRAEKEPMDHVTISNMLQCAALLPQGSQREAMIATTFDLCCRLGFVNEYVIRDLKVVANEELWRDLCQCPRGGDVDIERLPSQWSRRAKRSHS